MVTIDDAAALALALPGTREGTSYGHRAWFVADAKFAWERPFSKADLRRFGDAPVPAGPILAVTVDDLGERDALLATHPGVVFTIEHFADVSAVLVRLDAVARPLLVELVQDAFLAVAPPELAEAFRT